MNGLRVEVGGETVSLLPCRAAYWEQQRTLIVADLHLGKCETMRSAGLPIPLGVIERDLARLAGAILETGARRILVIGDLLHHGLGLTPSIIASVAQWRSREADEIQFDLVPGNHDRAVESVAAAWGVRVLPPMTRESPFAFVHEPGTILPADDASVVWSGHVHPMVRLVGNGDSIGLPCFVVSQRSIVLPAFSEFTGGVYVTPDNQNRLYAIAENQVIDTESLVRSRIQSRRAHSSEQQEPSRRA